MLKHWLESARRDDAARGVIWPTVDPAHIGKAGNAWQIFPNFQIGHAVNNALCYGARPFGYDPNKCIFEVSVYQLYPKGEEPKAQWEYEAADDPRWGSVLPQDFANMAAQGVRVVKWRIFSDGRYGLQFGDNGNVTGLDEFFFPDLDAALEIAKRHDLYLVFTLFSSGFWTAYCQSGQVHLGGQAITLTVAPTTFVVQEA